MFRQYSAIFRELLDPSELHENTNRYGGLLYNVVNPLTPNDHYSGHTAPLTSRHCILNIYSTNMCTEYIKHAA
jgi:hypothetical protein